MPNLLAGHVSLLAGTYALETLVKHYFDQFFGDKKAETSANGAKGLRKEELLYDEAFAIIKCFMEVSTLHTVEELQGFSNTRTPSSPWAHTVRVLVPMSCCDEAAMLLIDALGGEETTRKIVGGTKWWQVRGLKGVDAQWIVMKKDMQDAQRRQREYESRQREQEKARVVSSEKGKQPEHDQPEGSESSEPTSEPVYEPRMDDLRCILYFHGGGYYFGSIDQERYLMQRFARKTTSRLFAINYRLAPQYPFPCAIQDALAAYLYLIRPPPGARHSAVKPEHIVVSGDSAGGGLTLALLQILRDTGTPMPAGAVLISPWSDLTHSFPSVHQNTKTDVMPRYGLSLHKPSTLWPPPPDEMTSRVRASLRHRIKDFLKSYSDNESGGSSDVDAENGSTHQSQRSRSQHGHVHKSIFRRHFHKLRQRVHSGDEGYHSEVSSPTSKLRKFSSRRSGDVREAALSASGEHVDLGASAAAVLPPSTTSPEDGLPSQVISVKAENGEISEIRDQIHFYAPNNLLMHPLISPVVSYLGGLPPMLVIASDGEVLRDEILYVAHKAAHPEKYPVVEAARKLYPKLVGIEKRHKPTQVHLQVYDETAHVLPVLFSFCTPAKFCFRAMAAFVKYATGMPLNTTPATQLSMTSEETAATAIPATATQGLFRRASARMTNSLKRRSISANDVFTLGPPVSEPEEKSAPSNAEKDGDPTRSTSIGSGAMSNASSSPGITTIGSGGERYAGNAIVYIGNGDSMSPFADNMIRERVSITGVIRPLEAEENLQGCQHPTERVGVVPELAIRRYLEGSTLWRKKFKNTARSIARHRKRNLDIARKEPIRNVQQLQMHFFQNEGGKNGDGCEYEHGSKEHTHLRAFGSIRSHLSSRSHHAEENGIKEGLRKTAASWTWAWAIDGNERPPPSSIVARRDTEEARRLSKIADQPPDEADHRLTGNNLWSILVNALSTEKAKQELENRASEGSTSGGANSKETSVATGPETAAELPRFGELKDGMKVEVAASRRLSRMLSVRAKQHTLSPQLSAVKE